MQSYRILLIDEDDDFSESLRDSIEVSPYDNQIGFKRSSTIKDAFEQIAQWAPDLIVIDAHVEGMNSLDLTRLCCGKDTKVVMASDHMSVEIQQSAMKHGASDYFPKTNNPDELELVVHKLAVLCQTPQAKESE